MKRFSINKMTALLVLALLVMTGVFTRSAFADPEGGITIPEGYQEMELMQLEQSENVVIQFTYDVEQPDLYFINPYGQVLYPGVSPEQEIYAQSADGMLYVFLPEAEVGTWYLAYDKRGNNSIEIDFAYFEYGAREIAYVNNVMVNGDYVSCECLIEGEEYESALVRLSVVTLDEEGAITGSTLLYDGWSYCGVPQTLSGSLYEVPSGTYYLLLETAAGDYGFTTGTAMLSDTSFTYTNLNTPDAMDGVDVVVDFDKERIDLNWYAYREYCDHYIVTVRNQATKEIIVSEETSESMTSLLMDMSLPSVIVELQYVTGSGLVSEPFEKTVAIADVKNILRVETPELTNASYAKVVYEGLPIGTIIDLIWYNTNLYERFDVTTADGFFSVLLAEFENDFVLNYVLEDGVRYYQHFNIFVDLSAPVLTFYENLEGLVVRKDSYVLIGETEAGISLTVDGKAAEVAADGTFAITLAMKEAGTNLYTLLATDQAGNVTEQSVEITFEPETGVAQTPGTPAGTTTQKPKFDLQLSKWIYLVVSALMTLGVALTTIFSYEILRKKNTGFVLSVKTLRNTFLSTAIASLAATVYFFVQYLSEGKLVKGTTFIELAKQYLMEAYHRVLRFEFYRNWLYVFFAVFVAAVLATLICCIIIAAQKKKGTGSVKPAKRKAKPVTPVQPVVQPAPAPAMEQPVAQPAPAPAAEQPAVQPAPAPAVEQPAVQPAEERKYVFCTACGAKQDADAAFCCECGNRLS